MLLTSAYFPPVAWFALVAKEFSLSPDRLNSSVIYLEGCENYQKQSYRNRCRYLSSRGVDTLNVPVIHGTAGIRDIKVDWSLPWLLRTERAIESAYSSSPYFEYYRDDLFALLEKKPETLWDFNLSIIRFFLEKLHIQADIRFTDHFSAPGQTSEYGEDYRYVIHPKRPDTILEDLGLKKPYFQVFADKYGFQSDLSIMDLLFNEGPDSILFLKKLL